MKAQALKKWWQRDKAKDAPREAGMDEQRLIEKELREKK